MSTRKVKSFSTNTHDDPDIFYQLVEGRSFVREYGKTSTLEVLSEKVVKISMSG